MDIVPCLLRGGLAGSRRCVRKTVDPPAATHVGELTVWLSRERAL